MNAKEWAQLLNGREYGSELSREEEKQAATDGVIIAYGYSDDGVEFAGAAHYHAPAWEGGVFWITNGFEIYDSKKNKLSERKVKIIAIWCPTDVNKKSWASWEIRADVCEYHTFDIMEDGELFCRGIVFSKEAINE